MLAFKNSRESPISDSVTYMADWGAKNDGNSLQFINGEWIAALPTPGEENSTGEIAAPPPPPAATPSAPAANISTPPSTPLFTARISEKEKFAIVGVPAKFKGETVGTTEGLLGKTRFIWNFGDGSTAEGQSVAHVYKYPGDYIVMLNAVSGTHATEDRTTIKAIPAELSITAIGRADDFFIELSNGSAYELNLSGWLLKSGARYFVIPEHSFILPKKKIIFPYEATELSYSGEDSVGLLYPNGLTAAVFSAVPSSPKPSPSISTKKTGDAPIAKETIARPSPQIESPPPSVFQDENTASAAAFAQEVPKQSVPQSRGASVPWLFGTLALVVLGGAGVVLARRKKTPTDEFEIVEGE